jgi:hypothetical protein
VVEYLAAEGCRYQGPERSGGGVAPQVQVAYLLRENVQTWFLAECLYLRAKDLPDRHVPQVQGSVVGDGGAAYLCDGGGRAAGAGQRVRHHVG